MKLKKQFESLIVLILYNSIGCFKILLDDQFEYNCNHFNISNFSKGTNIRRDPPAKLPPLEPEPLQNLNRIELKEDLGSPRFNEPRSRLVEPEALPDPRGGSRMNSGINPSLRDYDRLTGGGGTGTRQNLLKKDTYRDPYRDSSLIDPNYSTGLKPESMMMQPGYLGSLENERDTMGFRDTYNVNKRFSRFQIRSISSRT